VVYVCDTTTYSPDQLAARLRDGVILLHGGGNLGDLWPDHQRLREAVIYAFPDKRIIQLPQSIHFREKDNLQRAKSVFNGHPDLTIFVRDTKSLALARNEFRARSVLCPDMAFALGPLRRPEPPDEGVVCLLRADTESLGHAAASAASGVELVDWLTDRNSFRLRLDRFLAGLRSPHPRVSKWTWPVMAPVYRELWEGLAQERLGRGCALLSRGRVVVTDRLHGHILSLLLGIPHVLLDNNYGKVSGFFEAWTQTSDLARLAKTPEEALALAHRLATAERESPRESTGVDGQEGPDTRVGGMGAARRQQPLYRKQKGARR
jgi:pyruvyl transferase EpsO